MKVSVSHLNGMQFENKTEKSSFVIDCPQITPLEYFLGGIISCSATDMILMPKKQGYEVKNLTVDGDAVRNDDHPRKFNALHMTYRFDSEADDDLAKKWVMASLETYCSTVNTIRDSVKVTYTVIHNGHTIKERAEIISGGGSSVDFGDLEGCPS